MASTASFESLKPRKESKFCCLKLSAKRRVQVEFVLYAVGVVLTTSSHDTLLSLQSSINIEKGLGVTSATASYITATLCGILFVPLLVQFFGAKVAMLYSHIAILIYICANFYPNIYTMIPGGVIVGSSQATMWSTMMLFCVHFSRRYARYSNKGRDFHNAEFIGTQMFMHKIFLTTGNLLSYAGLNLAGNGTLHVEINQTSFENTKYVHCGANDCQDPNVTDATLGKYVPAKQSTLHAVLGTLAGMIITGLLIHIFFLNDIDTRLEAQESQGGDASHLATHFNEEKVELKCDGEVLEDSNQNLKSLKENGSGEKGKVKRDGENQDNAIKGKVERGERLHTITMTLRAIGGHIFQTKQLLITPFAIFSGVFPGFVYAELTRAFASCIFGVAKVGLCAGIFNTVHCMNSLIVGMVISKYGRNRPLAFAVALTLGSFIFMLLWTPDQSTSWAVYLMFSLVAVAESIWRITVTEMHASYFPGQQNIAYPVWTTWLFCGFAVQFGWSASLCVRDKIYVQIAIVCFGSLCYCAAEVLRLRKRRTLNEKHIS